MTTKACATWSVIGLVLLMATGKPASAQTLAEIAAGMDEIEGKTTAGMEDLEACDASLRGILLEKPGDDEPLPAWQAYADALDDGFEACAVLAPGDPGGTAREIADAAIRVGQRER